MSKSKIKVLRSIPAKYKRQRTKFTLVDILRHQADLSFQEFQLLGATTAGMALTYEQMAYRFELPMGTVKSKLNRARAKLIRWLDDAALVATFEENLPPLRRRARR